MKTLFNLLSPAGSRARLTVLIFHRVLPTPDPLQPDEMHAARFDEVLSWVKSWFQVLPLDEAARRLTEGRLPARAAALTFDDGYADNHDVALPLLRQYGLPCSFFVATGFLDGGRMWNDTVIESFRGSQLARWDLRGLRDAAGQDLGVIELPSTLTARRGAMLRLIERVKYLAPEARQACVDGIGQRAEAVLPADLMMRGEQVLALHRAGMQVGAHTVSHPILARVSRAEAADEIQRSRDVLQRLIGDRVSLFAYPNGKPGQDYLPDIHPRMVRELGFDAAVSTRWATATRQTDVFQIPRFTPWDASRLKFGLRLARNLRVS